MASYCIGLVRLFTISPSVSWNDVDGELALFDARDGRYHALNRSGAAVWRGLACGLTIEEIAARLGQRYAAPVALITAEVDAFVIAALAQRLIERIGDRI